MTDEVLKLALDALEGFIPYLPLKDEVQCNRYDKAIIAIKEALETKDDPIAYINVEKRKLEWATKFITWETPTVVNLPKIPLYTTLQPKTKNEPVAWGMEKDGVILDVICPAEHEREEGGYTVPLYTTKQRRWVGLTDEEKAQFVVAYYPSNWDRKTAVSLMSDYEKYLKEKNNAI